MLKLIASLAAITIRALRHGTLNPHDPLCPARFDGPCRCAGHGRLCTCLTFPGRHGEVRSPRLDHPCPVHHR